MLFNPYTGRPRDPRDIQSDPEGILVLDPDEPLRAYATPPAADAVSEAMTDAALRAWYVTPEWRDTPKWSDSELDRMRAAIAAALAARGK